MDGQIKTTGIKKSNYTLFGGIEDRQKDISSRAGQDTVKFNNFLWRRPAFDLYLDIYSRGFDRSPFGKHPTAEYVFGCQGDAREHQDNC